MWLHLVQMPWSSLVIIPTDPSTSARKVATAILSMAPFYELGEFQFVDAQGATLQEGARIARVLAAGSEGHRTVIAVTDPLQEGGAMPVIMAADAAILLVRLGTSNVARSRSLIDIVGRERVLGGIAVH
jgi:hypothetical protein